MRSPVGCSTWSPLMSSRADMDRPAMVTAALLGVVLIAITIPYFTGGGAGGGAQQYSITWSEATAASNDGTTGAANQEQSFEVEVTDVNPANAVVELTSCNDGAVAIQQPATISWTLTWENHNEAGTASCAQQGPFENAVEPQPDVASAEGTSDEDARAAAYAAADGNETVTFTLTYEWSR